jgi:hypothetical protein
MTSPPPPRNTRLASAAASYPVPATPSDADGSDELLTGRGLY